jgi:hypothetical protein
MSIIRHSQRKVSAKNAEKAGITRILSKIIVANITPAIGGATTWNFITDGPLSFPNSGNWTIRFNEPGEISVKMWGGGGTHGSPVGSLGGGGGFVGATFLFNSDINYTLTVAGGGTGSVGGFGGGGVGGPGSGSGGGGGYSGIFRGSNTFANVVIIAAGGGGSGGNDTGVQGAGGEAGGLNGAPGKVAPVAGSQGSGGTQGAGGAGGVGSPGTPGSPGVALRGGNGGPRGPSGSAGGGAGGGYYGGGGGGGQTSINTSGGGGGGGSSYISPLYTVNTLLIPGANNNAGANTDPVNGGAGAGGTAPSRNGANGKIYLYLITG